MIIKEYSCSQVIVDNGSMQKFYPYLNMDIKKGTCINKVLKIIKKEMNPRKILIISGIKAGRGQSYKTEDENEWHVTDLIYCPARSTPCDSIIQSMGRITGIYENKNIREKLQIWSRENVKRSIKKYNRLQSKVS